MYIYKTLWWIVLGCTYLVHTSSSIPITIPKLIIQLDKNMKVHHATSVVTELYKKYGMPHVEPEIIEIGDLVTMVVPAGNQDFVQQLSRLGPIRSVEQEKKWSFAGTVTSNVARVQQRHQYQHGQQFKMDSNAGAGVEIFILDSGCYTNHPDLLGRSYVMSAMSPDSHVGRSDVHGHGSHVAATAGGKTFGIARGANLVCVQIMNAHGTYTGGAVLRGLGFVSAALRRNPNKKVVVNMSISGPGGGNSAVNVAVNALVRMGAAVVVAAGNNSADACAFSPAAASLAITVGAMDTFSDFIAPVSNVGKCVNIFAPGVDILSVAKNRGSTVMTGTSMAAPHVSGALAVLMAQNMNSVQATNQLFRLATRNTVNGNLRGSPNLMLFLDGNNLAPKA